MNLDMAMFQQTFFEETADILLELEGLLLRLAETPDDPELLNTIFRCAHSIKGGSATFGLTDMAHFTHSLETLLDLLRNGQMRVDSLIVQLLLSSLDQLKALLAAARGESDAAPDSGPLIFQIEEAISITGYAEEAWDEDALRAEIAQMLAGQDGEILPETPVPSRQADDGLSLYTLVFTPGLDVLREGTDPLVLLQRLREAGEIVAIRCDASRLPALDTLDPEASYLRWEVDFRSDWDRERLLDIFEFVLDSSEVILTQADDSTEDTAGLPEGSRAETAHSPAEMPSPLPLEAPSAIRTTPDTAAAAPVKEAASLPPQQTAPPRNVPTNKAEAPTLRVSADKVDKLINLVGELVINQSMLNEVAQQFSMEKLPRLIEAVADMERACRELQERVMAVRMLPIKNAFGRFPRLVHDLAVACNKKIELKTSGEETELDKSVIEAIADPLTHLVRNSIDHGLETPEERRAAGKPETGQVSLHANHEGGSIVIEIADDGRGLNGERILRKAIERGLLSENDPPPSDETLYNFIFHPGFSTAAQVTDLSGRGVGMDIVKQSVQALGGSISLTSRPGKGTRFLIRLPLTMAILEGLSVSVGEEIYILPLTSIIESIRPKSADVRVISGQTEVVVVRGEVLPIRRLHQVFHAIPRVFDPAQGLLVIVENEGHRVALLVDELIGQSQVVIKSLETNYRKVDGVAGATILGDGRVALILDVPALTHGLPMSSADFAAAA